jgi:phospho-N-acetylmuramoyl-pentapeptide-transferase
MQQSFFAFSIALVAGAIFAGPILKGLIALKSRQTIYNLAPESHQKKQGTPTMGGIIILLGLICSVAATTHNLALIGWMIGFGLIGFADDYVVPKLLKDKRGLGWKQKIIAQVLLAVAAAYVFQIPLQPVPIAITAFLVLFFCNAYNFADGLDGLAGSLGLLLCMGFIALSAFAGDLPAIVLLAALAGAFIPFLFLNAPPAKVFMGDVGSLPIGAVFGAIAASLLLRPTLLRGQELHTEMLAPILILSFVMIAELVPVPMQVGFYKLTKKRLFPMTPIHHSFEVKGWPESRVVWSFFLAQLTLAVIAIGVASSSFVSNPPAPQGVEARR